MKLITCKLCADRQRLNRSTKTDLSCGEIMENSTTGSAVGIKLCGGFSLWDIEVALTVNG